MDIRALKYTFRYNPRLGHLYRGTSRVKGTPKYPGGPKVVGFRGRMLSLGRVAFILHHGYAPAKVRHRDGNHENNKIENLFDPAREEKAEPSKELAHAGKYLGVCVMRCQRTGKHRGYQGSVYHGGKRHRTPVVETAEMARDLRLLLAAQVEWEAQQKENAQ